MSRFLYLALGAAIEQLAEHKCAYGLLFSSQTLNESAVPLVNPLPAQVVLIRRIRLNLWHREATDVVKFIKWIPPVRFLAV